MSGAAACVRGCVVRLGRRRALVRLHMTPQAGSGTIEGFLLGRWSGHYVLTRARFVEAPDRSVGMDGDVEVPAGNVLCVQRLRGEG